MAARGASVPLPADVVCAKEFAATAVATTKAIADVTDDDMILDIGPRSGAALADLLAKAGTIVWNGPVGVFEFDQFAGGTGASQRRLQPHRHSRSQAGRHHCCHQQVRHCRQGELHLDGWRRLPRVPEGKTLPAVAALEARRIAW